MTAVEFIPERYRTPDKIGAFVASLTRLPADDLIFEPDPDDEYRVDVLYPIPGDDTGMLDVVATISLFTNTIRIHERKQ